MDHSVAFGATAGGTQTTHDNVNTIEDIGTVLYYRVKVENSKWSTPPTKVNLVGDRARPDSLARGPDSATATSPKVDANDSLTASTDKYLTRIDLKWAFEDDDFAVVPEDPNTAGTQFMPGSPRPTGFLIDYYIESAAEAATDNPPANIYWQPLQSNTGHARGTYNHIRGLKPGQKVHYRVFSWHTNNYGIPAAVMGSTKAAVSPDPVRGLRTTADGPTKIKLDWDAVPSANNGGSPITHYAVQVFVDQPSRPGASEIGWVNAGTSTNTTLTFSGVGSIEPLDKLVAEQGAWFRVFAVNSKKQDSLGR